MDKFISNSWKTLFGVVSLVPIAAAVACFAFLVHSKPPQDFGIGLGLAFGAGIFFYSVIPSLVMTLLGGAVTLLLRKNAMNWKYYACMTMIAAVPLLTAIAFFALSPLY